MRVRTGRRPGKPETRDVILAAARTAFAERGYDGASIRHIAAAASVDPALVHHYFGTKDQLFTAAMDLPFDPPAIVADLLEEGADGLGERLVRRILVIWDSPAGAAAAGVLRSAVSHDWSTRMLREFVERQVLGRVAATLDVPDAKLRASLAGSQVIGLLMARYIVKVEPLASAPHEVVVAAVGPTIQRYLTGDL